MSWSCADGSGIKSDVRTAAPKIQYHILTHLLHTENTSELLSFIMLVKK
jgi:hypothetical protein